MQNIPRSEPICITSKLVNVKEVSISSIFLFFNFIRILVGFGQPDKRNRFWPQVKVADHTILLGKWENRGSNLRISETIKKKRKRKNVVLGGHDTRIPTGPSLRFGRQSYRFCRWGKRNGLGRQTRRCGAQHSSVFLKQHDCSRKCISSERHFHVDPMPPQSS